MYGGNYADYDISGFDECFPALAAGHYPEWPWEGTCIPAHGELWSSPWENKVSEDHVRLEAYGIRFPYRFMKTISLEEDSVIIKYQLKNLSSFEFKYIWAAHSLLSVTPGTKIVLPGKPMIRTDWSKHDRLGKVLYETTWPQAKTRKGDVVDMSIVGSPDLDEATKFYTTELEQGWCALYKPDTGNFIKFSFPLDKVPYVGVWKNEGGWPLEGNSYYHVALEPCTGCPDKLDTAIQRGEYAQVNGREETTWSLKITVGISDVEPS